MRVLLCWTIAAIGLERQVNGEEITKEAVLDIVGNDGRSFPALSAFEDAVSQAENASVFEERFFNDILQASQAVGAKAVDLTGLAENGTAPLHPNIKKEARESVENLADAIKVSADSLADALVKHQAYLTDSVIQMMATTTSNLRKTQAALIALNTKIDLINSVKRLSSHSFKEIEVLEGLLALWSVKPNTSSSPSNQSKRAPSRSATSNPSRPATRSPANSNPPNPPSSTTSNPSRPAPPNGNKSNPANPTNADQSKSDPPKSTSSDKSNAWIWVLASVGCVGAFCAGAFCFFRKN